MTSVESPVSSEGAVAVATPRAARPRSAAGTILVVDGDRIHRRILGGILRSEGWRVEELTSGEEALVHYAARAPDLVLMAVQLPGMSGFDTCRRLRALHGECVAPVIFLTARDSADDVVAGFNAGAADYVPKPWRAREVVVRIRSHLQNRLLAARQQSLLGELGSANAAKDRFVSLVAHDLRSPLAGMRGLIEFLVETRLDDEQREMVTLIHESSRSMLELVEKLHEFAQLESGRLRLTPIGCRLAKWLEQAVGRWRPEAARRQVRLEVVAAEGAPELRVDPEQLGRVLDQLVSNALKFSPAGAVVTVAEVADEAGAGFAVRDQGPGFPEEERHLLFREFSRLSSRPAREVGKGSGLGLAIARRLVEAHGGTIGAANLRTGGCEFSVRLPLAS